MFTFIPFSIAFFITLLLIPGIIEIARIKHLCEIPNARSSHTVQTPSLGGVAIIGGILMSVLIWSDGLLTSGFQDLMCALIVIFAVGLKDDLIGISPKYKFTGQILAAILLISSGLSLNSLFGFFGIEELPVWASYGLTLFFIVFTANAYNLIDGINGLAGGLTLSVTCIFGAWFFYLEDYLFAILAFSTLGSILAFLRYNLMPARIFMGDCGSLVSGFLVAIFSLRFLSTYPIIGNNFIADYSVLGIVLSLSFIPFFDTLRVFTIRIYSGRSPFSADKRHLHHLLLNLNYSHLQATTILVISNILCLLFALFLQTMGLGTLTILFSLLVISTIASYTLYISGLPSKEQNNRRISYPIEERRRRPNATLIGQMSIKQINEPN